MKSIERKDGLTTIRLGNMTIKTRLINRHAYNRLRKEDEAGKLRMHQVLAVLSEATPRSR